MTQRTKKWISTLLIICVFTVCSGISAFAYTIQLTMPLCVSLAISKSRELREIRSDLQDARAHISAIRRDMRDVEFWESRSSSWWNDLWDTYTEEMDSYNEIADLEAQIKELMFSESSLRLEIKDNVQQAYYEVLENLYLLEMQRDETETLTQSVASLNYQRAMNQTIDENDLILAREKLADSQSEEENVEANLLDAKKRLGDVLDIDVRYGYTFASQFYSDMMEDGNVVIDVQEAVDYAIRTDADSGMAYYEYQGARTLVNYVSARYQEKFGYALWRIRDYLRQDVANIDFDEFRQAYDTFYDHIDDPWDWILFIWYFPFIIIPLYGMWFRPTGYSTRYLKDAKYALYDLLKEEYKAENAYLDAEKTKRISVENGYTTVRNLYNTYENSLENIERVKRNYQVALEANRNGEMTFEQVENVREQLVDAQQTAFENLISYNTELSTFDRTTCGYLWYKLTGESFSISETISGFSYGQDETRPMYLIEVNIEDMLIDFSIQMNDSPIEATHYEVWTSTGRQIGERTPISSKISHLPLTMVDEETMYVRLYQDGELTHTAMFAGTQSEGYLEFETASEPTAYNESDGLGGTFLLEDGALSTVLTLQLNETYQGTVAFYDVVTAQTGEKLGGSDGHTPIEEGFVHLGSTLNDFENLRIITYNSSGAQVQRFSMEERNGEYVLVES